MFLKLKCFAKLWYWSIQIWYDNKKHASNWIRANKLYHYSFYCRSEQSGQTFKLISIAVEKMNLVVRIRRCLPRAKQMRIAREKINFIIASPLGALFFLPHRIILAFERNECALQFITGNNTIRRSFFCLSPDTCIIYLLTGCVSDPSVRVLHLATYVVFCKSSILKLNFKLSIQLWTFADALSDMKNIRLFLFIQFFPLFS